MAPVQQFFFFGMTPTTDVYYMLSSQITLYSLGHTKKKNHWIGWCQPSPFWCNNKYVNICIGMTWLIYFPQSILNHTIRSAPACNQLQLNL